VGAGVWVVAPLDCKIILMDSVGKKPLTMDPLFPWDLLFAVVYVGSASK
jgi:hypothetical protein